MPLPDDHHLLRHAAEYVCPSCLAARITQERAARYRAERELRAAAAAPPGGGPVLPI